MSLILASTSAARATMLSAAGVTFAAQAPGVDEESLKAGLEAKSVAPRDVADALAEMKAVKLSRRHPGELVLGGDQVLVAADGMMLDKPASIDEARGQLRALRGATHKLISAAVLARGGGAIWRHVDEATLAMRALSDGFIEDYLAAEGEALFGCVGGYRIEGYGAQLFARVEGSHFTILGLPLLPVLDQLRVLGEIAS